MEVEHVSNKAGTEERNTLYVRYFSATLTGFQKMKQNGRVHFRTHNQQWSSEYTLPPCEKHKNVLCLHCTILRSCIQGSVKQNKVTDS